MARRPGTRRNRHEQGWAAALVLIDAHVHLGEQGLGLEQDRDALLAAMDGGGIDQAVVVTAGRPGHPDVEQTLAAVKDHPRLHVVEGVRITDPTDLEQVERRLAAGRVRGLKLYPGYEPVSIGDERMEPFYGLAARFDVPVLFHTGDTVTRWAHVRHAHPLLVDDVATEHPETRFVICHAGNPWFMDCAEVMHKNENVVADVSGFVVGEFTERHRKSTQERLNHMIAFVEDVRDRLMFGTDWPLAQPLDYMEFMEGLDLTPEEREGVMWRTARQVYKLP